MNFPWPRYIDRLKELVTMPLTYPQIAAQLQTESGLPLHTDALVSKVRAMGMRKQRGKYHAQLKLHDPKIDLLKELWSEGRSAQQIADVLDWSRNAVIGKVHRLGLESHKSGGKKPKALAGSAAASVAHRIKEVAKARTPTAIKPQPVIEIEETVVRSACSILDLQFDSCRWIIGNPKKPLDPIYCGGRAIEGRSYCACHAVRAAA